EVVAVRLHRGGGDDHAAPRGQGRQQRGVRLAEARHEGVLVGRLVRLHEAQLRGAGRAGGGVLDAVEVVDDGFGVDGRAVVEARVLDEVEGVGETVVADLPRLGQARGRHELLVHLDDRGEDVVQDVARRRRVRDVRVEVGRVVGDGDRDGAAVAGLLRAGAGDQAERDERGEQDGKQTAVLHVSSYGTTTRAGASARECYREPPRGTTPTHCVDGREIFAGWQMILRSSGKPTPA